MRAGRWAAYALVWAVVVAAGASVAWLAIARVGREVSLLSDAPVVSRPILTVGGMPSTAASAAPGATTAADPSTPVAVPAETPTPSPTRVVRPAPVPGPPPAAGGPPVPAAPAAPATIEGSKQTDGGRVFAACSGSTLIFRSAQAADGWTVSKSVEPEHIEVKFRRDERKVEVTVACVGGAPRFSVE